MHLHRYIFSQLTKFCTIVFKKKYVHTYVIILHNATIKICFDFIFLFSSKIDYLHISLISGQVLATVKPFLALKLIEQITILLLF